MLNKFGAYIILTLGLILLIGCQTQNEPVSGNISINTNQGPRSAVVHMAKLAQKCWFKTKDPTFKPYTLAAEVNSHAGRPRFLIVPRKNPGGLPLLVVQAEAKGDKSSGKFTNIQSFGPLLQGSASGKISADIRRWSTGKGACSV